MTHLNKPSIPNISISKLAKLSLSALLLCTLENSEADNSIIQTSDKKDRTEIMLSTGKIVSLDSVKTTNEYKKWSEHVLENSIHTEEDLVENLDTTFLERHFFEDTHSPKKTQDPIINTKKNNDRWDQPFPKLSTTEKKKMEEYLNKHTLLSDILTSKAPMRDIRYIALHSTGTESRNVITYLQEVGKVHYIVDRNGEIKQYMSPISGKLAQQNHLGESHAPVSCASWQGDGQVTFKTIGIEVIAGPAETRNDAQYEAVKKLLWYLGDKYKLTEGSVITHTMVAYSPQKGLMRKYDPYNVDWKKLDLLAPTGQINQDVVKGKIAPNLISMYKWLRRKKVGMDPGPELNHEEAIAYLYANYDGVNHSILLHRKKNHGRTNPNAHLANQANARLTIKEIDISQKYSLQ